MYYVPILHKILWEEGRTNIPFIEPKRLNKKRSKKMSNIETRNAVIASAEITNADHGILSAWINLDYNKNLCQSFGGYTLYVPNVFKHRRHDLDTNWAGHFIFRVLRIAGVSNWSELKGQTIRIKLKDSKIQAIGHIIHDHWFDPSEDFKLMENIKNKEENQNGTDE